MWTLKSSFIALSRSNAHGFSGRAACRQREKICTSAAHAGVLLKRSVDKFNWNFFQLYLSRDKKETEISSCPSLMDDSLSLSFLSSVHLFKMYRFFSLFFFFSFSLLFLRDYIIRNWGGQNKDLVHIFIEDWVYLCYSQSNLSGLWKFRTHRLL